MRLKNRNIKKAKKKKKKVGEKKALALHWHMLHAIWATASSGFFRAPAWIGVEKSAQVNANTKRKHSRALSATACVWCIYHWCHTPNAYARTCSGHVSERKFIILLYKHIHIYAGVYMCLCVCGVCVCGVWSPNSGWPKLIFR